MHKLNVYYRGTNNPHEPNLIASGQLRCSLNHLTGQKELGVSVAEEPTSLYKRFSIVCKVQGTPLNHYGSDGEILLDVSTIRLIL